MRIASDTKYDDNHITVTRIAIDQLISAYEQEDKYDTTEWVRGYYRAKLDTFRIVKEWLDEAVR